MSKQLPAGAYLLLVGATNSDSVGMYEMKLSLD